MTYTELVQKIRDYTEVTSTVLTDTIVNGFIENAEFRILRDVDSDNNRRYVTAQLIAGTRFIDKVTITLYLTPGDTQAGKFIYFYYVKRSQDAGKYTNEADVVNRFVPCMCAGLTYYISMKKAPQRTQEMKLYYEDELQRALTEDGSPASVYISPKTYYPEI